MCKNFASSGLAPHVNGLLAHAVLALRVDGFGKLASVPIGYGAPNAGLAPAVLAGAMSSYKRAKIEINATGEGAEGLGGAGTATITLDASAFGGLIAGGVGTATITVGATGDMLAIVVAVGTATVTISGVADLGALGWSVGNATITVDGSLAPYAVGSMSGTTADQGLSVAGIANAVWAKMLEGGSTAEEALLAAGAGADPSVIAGTIAAAVVAALNATTIPVNTKKINDVTVVGSGTEVDPWGPA